MSITSTPTSKPGSVYTSHVVPDEDELSFELQPGDRLGWWEELWDDSSCSLAFVHGSVYHHRTLLMLDSGASTPPPRDELLFNGNDGVKTKVTNNCRVKKTLGHRVVYT
ncbi:hypothetical protein PHMEG_00028169 [Phytophthora megakarya]|uniref:Uncharacterized protein n=1 Tax=Phytophthora megakarya TaxID=4795 RepID=A0A225V5H8_9STRA|nr:hypothetical protein PHMEG_00028169 [Phytophthora megakarya]